MSVTHVAFQRPSTKSQTGASRIPKQADATAESGGWDESIDRYFGQFAELANLIFGSAIASLSLSCPARLWIKSMNQRLSIADFEGFSESCATIKPIGEILVLPDIDQDAEIEACRRRHNLDELRFFVRAPLRSGAGDPMGSLCIADSVSRHDFSSHDLEILKLLASTISEAVEAKRPSSEPKLSEIEAKDRYALVARATLDGVWDWDLERETVYYSPRWQHILGLAECDIIAGVDHWLSRVHPDDLSAVKEGLDQNLSGQTSRFRSEHRVRHGDGSWRWIAVRGLAQRNSSNMPIRMAGSVADVTEERTSDTLTGLSNRLSLIDRTSQLIERGKKTGNWHFALLAIDIDRMALFNDKFGHACGDTILRTIADRLRETVTRTRMDGDSLVCRFESDKFFVILDGVKDASQAHGIAARIHTAIKRPIECEHEPLKVRASIGIATAKSNLCTPEQLLNNSEIALSRAKATRSTSTIVLTSSIEQEATSRIEMEESILEALRLNQLTTYYQPQVNLRTGQLMGCEALVRWIHPTRGIVQPKEFIQLSEEMGLISNIDSWVLESACRQLAEWRRQYGLSNFTISVNISGHSLAKRGLRAEVQEVLSQYSIPANALCLELTESVLLKENPSSIKIMQELRKIGVGLHMDDFGVGYSSFKNLYELPFDALKIDRTFMSHFPSDPRARNVIEGILALARTMGLFVIAEGIEDPLQARTLKLMGCEVGQGFLFDRPLSNGQFCEKYLASETRATRTA